MEAYLSPTYFIDSDHPDIVQFSNDNVGESDDPIQQMVNLYYAVRDSISYDPYHVDLSNEALKASAVLKRGSGFCVEKANLLAASARAIGIPSRLGLADVKNHLGAERLIEILRSDLFVCHGYTELYLGSQWVKATPAFNEGLCKILQVKPLPFNGLEDSVFQEFDGPGERKFMEYVKEHGHFSDMPHEFMRQILKDAYPHLFENGGVISSDSIIKL